MHRAADPIGRRGAGNLPPLGHGERVDRGIDRGQGATAVGVGGGEDDADMASVGVTAGHDLVLLPGLAGVLDESPHARRPGVAVGDDACGPAAPAGVRAAGRTACSRSPRWRRRKSPTAPARSGHRRSPPLPRAADAIPGSIRQRGDARQVKPAWRACGEPEGLPAAGCTLARFLPLRRSWDTAAGRSERPAAGPAGKDVNLHGAHRADRRGRPGPAGAGALLAERGRVHGAVRRVGSRTAHP